MTGRLVAAFAAVFLIGATARAQVDPCAAAKLTATGKKCKTKFRCVGKAAASGSGTVDADCLAKAETRFSSAFVAAESRGDCNTSGDAAVVEGKVDAHVLDIRGELWNDEPAENDCAGAKLYGAAKKCACKVKCYAKAARKGVDLDPPCVAKCADRFAKAFSKAESRGGCTTIGDGPAIEVQIDAFAADADSELRQ
jgi:hypothetical protein